MLAVVEPDVGEHAVAEPHCTFDDGLENRVGSRWRPADHIKHFARRGLMFQRFSQFLGTRLHLVEQTHVLDRNHRLVGESRDQLYFLSVNGCTRRRSTAITPIGVPSRRSGTASACESNEFGFLKCIKPNFRDRPMHPEYGRDDLRGLRAR